MELVNIVRSLVWTVLIYGAERWILTKADEKGIESTKLWISRRILRISWTEHRTFQSILTELNIYSNLLCAASAQGVLLWTHNQGQ